MNRFGEGRGRRDAITLAVIFGVAALAFVAATVAIVRVSNEVQISLPVLPDAEPQAEMPSLVALPFRELAGRREVAELALDLGAGVADLLAKGGLRIPPASETERWRGLEPSSQEVADALGVRYVVGGTVMGAVDGLRVDVVLFDGVLGNEMFRGTFYGTIDGELDLRQEIAGALLAVLRFGLPRG